ncbi:hypothetical protein, partial [Plasticicumulans sp.]|uniref:hypothetical protein n=1 Tax=Plasticicumulans sp. TaxID=2307179 RepID=UPI002B576ED2
RGSAAWCVLSVVIGLRAQRHRHGLVHVVCHHPISCKPRCSVEAAVSGGSASADFPAKPPPELHRIAGPAPLLPSMPLNNSRESLRYPAAHRLREHPGHVFPGIPPLPCPFPPKRSLPPP